MSDSLKEALIERAVLSPTAALAGRFELAAAPRSGVAEAASAQARQGFRVGELRFLIRYEEASELVEMPAIHRLPNAPDWFLGIANLHGKLVPVFDLADYVGIAPDKEARQMLLVLAHGNDATGVLIDGLPERLRQVAGADSDVAVAPERLRQHLHRICQINKQLWLDLDTRSMLLALEQSLEGVS